MQLTAFRRLLEQAMTMKLINRRLMLTQQDLDLLTSLEEGCHLRASASEWLYRRGWHTCWQQWQVPFVVQLKKPYKASPHLCDWIPRLEQAKLLYAIRRSSSLVATPVQHDMDRYVLSERGAQMVTVMVPATCTCSRTVRHDPALP